MKLWLTAGALSGLIAVALGAFGAHGLANKVPADQLNAFEVGARYQMYHALALLAVAWLASREPSSLVSAAGAAFIIGTLLFSGSLYVLGLTGSRALVLVTPIGGLSFMIGWVCLLVAGLRAPA
ncbi:MAG TPA: DUF423 domain-containing protein [Parvibaculum sp.]|uniref:DUF423 domain-containing protein n=1 Tax=Parvibaculum sp. TaxID=2024848 RepID=UPI002BA5D5B0|nr:DUF423 domain-containing protein [Parvibaculum sp.]HMM13775.1 DUF423 domain-containing protein [Parvibaculum sp.]